MLDLKTIPVPLRTDAAITVSNLIDQRGSYNLNPPYQRGNVWVDSWKVDLIRSMIKNLPLAPFTLVERENENQERGYLVLDGKQRMSSVFDFIDGKFKLPLLLGNEEVKMTFLEIEKRSRDKKYPYHSIIQNIYSTFKNYNFKAVIYPDISWDIQIELFNTINHSKELSGYDRFNSPFIFAKGFVNWFFASYIPLCDAYLNMKFGKKIDSTSGCDLFTKFRLLAVLTGLNLDKPEPCLDKLPKVEVRGIGDIRRFVSALNQKISEYMTKKDDQYLFDEGNKERVEEMFKEFGWKDLATNASFFNKNFELILSQDKKKGKFQYLLFYFASIMTENFHADVITNNLFDKEKAKIIDIFNQYYAWADADKNRTRRSGDRGTMDGSMKFHLEKIKELISDSGLDLGKKNPLFTKEEIEAIVKEAGGKCEICGSNENLQIDHVNPASLSSVKIGGLLCETHNRTKGDNTIDSLQANIVYINKKTG